MQNAWKYIKIALLILIPLVLIFLPADFFDTGKSMCLSMLLLDTECYGCGMTRACMRLIHLDFPGAWSFNKLSVVAFPILCLYWLNLFLKTIGKNTILRRFFG